MQFNICHIEIVVFVRDDEKNEEIQAITIEEATGVDIRKKNYQLEQRLSDISFLPPLFSPSIEEQHTHFLLFTSMTNKGSEEREWTEEWRGITRK